MPEKTRFHDVLDIPPENLPLRPEEAQDEFVDPELPEIAPAPLPAAMVAHWSERGVDLAGLDERDLPVLQPLADLPARSFRDFVARAKQVVRELLTRKHKTLPARIDEPPKSAPFDPIELDVEKRLERLRRRHDEAARNIRSLPESQQPAARERMQQELRAELKKFTERLLETRRGLARIVDMTRETLYENLTTADGSPLGDSVNDLDWIFDHERFSVRDRERAWKKIEARETRSNALSMEEFISARSPAGDADRSLGMYGRAEALIRQYGIPEKIGDEIIEGLDEAMDRRNAINKLFAQHKTPEEIFRVCFGRQPKGKVTVVQGPVTVYFRCRDLEDYALIYSQDFAEGPEAKSSVSASEAERTGGVSISTTRARALSQFPDADLMIDKDTVNIKKLRERFELLSDLRGAIIAENNSGPDLGFAFRWPIYRHEEQHAIKNMLFDRELSLTLRAVRKEAEDTIRLENTIRSAHSGEMERTQQKGAPGAKKARRGAAQATEEMRARIEERRGAAEKKILELTRRLATDRIDARAKDEILAYYRGGNLGDALEHLYSKPGLPITTLKPYLKRKKEEGGLYDYHADPEIARATAWEVLAASGPLALGGFVGELRQEAAKAVTEHRAVYEKRLDRAGAAIKALEKAGYAKTAIIDLLTFEPLRTWPRLAARFVTAAEAPKL